MSASSFPSHSFHGSNSSSSKDNGSGSRNYHVPNHATSYANDKSKLISVKFEEDKGITKAIAAIVSIFLLFAAVPLCLAVLRFGPAAPGSSSATSVIQDYSGGLGATQNNGGMDWERPQSQDKVNDSARKGTKLSSPHWDELVPDSRCLGFGTREYTARLWGLPFFSNWMETCKDTETNIRNVVVQHPSYCENKWPFGGIIGHWIVDFGEQDCVARWGKIVDQGCLKDATKTRRFQARLWDIKSRHDWTRICATAPVVIHGLRIPKPNSCDDRGLWGIYGIWDLEDSNCE
ncbi:hypothetical protein CPC08DRAFT_757203 [Agrocybe pediades]|nr:hypothetical protein CPC08DRAFT_757203 [Agrocybe pediades]